MARISDHERNFLNKKNENEEMAMERKQMVINEDVYISPIW